MPGAVRGDWVRVHQVVLEPSRRAARLPEETRRVPLEMWVKGTLLNEAAAVGDPVTIRTMTGREVQGRLDAVHPSYAHSFGSFLPELQQIAIELREILLQGGRDDAEPQL